MKIKEPRMMYARYISRIINANKLNRATIAGRLNMEKGAFDALLLQPLTVQQNTDILGVIYDLIGEKGEQYAS